MYPTEKVKKGIEIADKVYNNELNKDKAIQLLEEHGFPNGTAKGYISMFLNWMNGEPYKTNAGANVDSVLLKWILKKYGVEQLSIALKAYQESIHIIENREKPACVLTNRRKVLEEYEAILSDLPTQRLPKFFNYDENNADSGYEAIQDFYLSWTIRCAEKQYEKIDSRLHQYAKAIVYALIHGKNEEGSFVCQQKGSFEVTKVRAERQWKFIDLLAEVETIEDGQAKKYVINIENKWYSSIREGQLEKSKKHVEFEYGNQEISLIHLIIFGDYEKLKNPSIKALCTEKGYIYLTIEDLQDFANIKKIGATGNELFDEYWYRF